MSEAIQTAVHSWADLLGAEKQKPYFQQIMTQLKSRAQAGATIYPAAPNMFNALKLTPLDQVKVVILGQDPYHGPNQAHGLCFSVQPGVPAPPSLKNIFKEISTDLNIPLPTDPHLDRWAKQGVLLLNTTLTVEAGQAASHAGLGWQTFTDAIIRGLSQHSQGIVFLLWGSHAQSKIPLIDTQKHHILKAPHPSPLSAHRGFLGCKHFSKCNQLLELDGKPGIDWK